MNKSSESITDTMLHLFYAFLLISLLKILEYWWIIYKCSIVQIGLVPKRPCEKRISKTQTGKGVVRGFFHDFVARYFSPFSERLRKYIEQQQDLIRR